MSRRKQIELSPEEREEYLRSTKTVTLSTIGADGYPHAIAMWFDVADDGTIWMTTYRKSQKAVNIRRNPKVALSAESGTTYDTLKGVLVRGDAELVDETERVLEVLKRVHARMFGAFPVGVDDAMRGQAAKRVAIKVTPKKVASWDHSKLAAGY